MDTSARRRLLAVTSVQRGLVTVKQAGSVGVTPPMLRAATCEGWLYRERRGVYGVAGIGPSPWRGVLAAALAAGPGATLSHTTAAAIHQFHGVKLDRIELTVPAPSHCCLDGVRVHRCATLSPGHVQNWSGARVTDPIRTVIDLAARFDNPLLGLVLDEGAIARLWTVEDIAARIADGGRTFPGVADLRRLLAERLDEGHPDSRLEQRVIRVVKPVFPGYTLHHRVVLDGEVIEMDIAWVDDKIDGEVDGMRTRAASRTKFERTCRRENILAAHGWRIVHFTDKMDDRTLIAQVAPLLGLKVPPFN